MNSPKAGLVAFLVGLTACSSPAPETPAPRLVLEDCSRDVGIAEAQCGALEVFEDRSAGTGRKIALNIVVLPAVNRDPKPDPLFFLAGGPGVGATEIARMVSSVFRRTNRKRDIVLVDQRGTGSSNPLDCEFDDLDFAARFEIKVQVEDLQACLDSFDADPRLYTTPIAMDDLDEVREALGYERINLYGGSYGTRAALVYMRRHSQHVRAVVLDGLAPPSFKLPLNMGVDGRRALDRTLADCEAEESCRDAFPDIRSKFNELLERLEKRPEKLVLPDPHTGAESEVEIHRLLVAGLVRGALYSTETSSLLPLLIERAHAGDFRPLVAMGAVLQKAESLMSQGMLLSVVCSEDVALISQKDRERTLSESFLRAELLDRFKEACGVWPKGELPEGYHDPVASDLPVLLLSGELDPVTPPRWGEEVSSHLSAARHIVVPGVGHGTLAYGCVPRLMDEFIEKGSADELDAGCVERLHRFPFFSSNTGPRVGRID